MVSLGFLGGLWVASGRGAYWLDATQLSARCLSEGKSYAMIWSLFSYLGFASVPDMGVDLDNINEMTLALLLRGAPAPAFAVALAWDH